jgi:hypothetical protein
MQVDQDLPAEVHAAALVGVPAAAVVAAGEEIEKFISLRSDR